MFDVVSFVITFFNLLKMEKHTTFWKYIRDYPPPLVRILARRSLGRTNRAIPLTDEEIAITGEIPLERVREIMFYPSWDEVTMGDIQRFLRGCNFDPTNYADRHRATMYSKKGKYQYWKGHMFQTHFIPLQQVLWKLYKA